MRTSEQGSPKKFPFKLYEMLQTAEEDIISFQPHGRSFMIRDVKRFKKEVLPRHFYQRRMAFFVSQLSSYGFVPITSGRDEGAYYHELFVKGEPGLLHFLRKVKVKGACKDTEPDFYKTEISHPEPCRSDSSTPPLQEEEMVVTPNEVSSSGTVATAPGHAAAVGGGKEKQLDLPKEKKASTVHFPLEASSSNIEPAVAEREFVLPGEEELGTLGSSAAEAKSLVATDVIKQLQAELSTPTFTHTCGPLVVPGRLRPQPMSKPTAIRFVPTPDQTDIQQAEAFRWTAPLQMKPISTELEVRSTSTEELPPMPVTPLSSPMEEEGQKCEMLSLEEDEVFPNLPLSEPSDSFMKVLDIKSDTPMQPTSLDDDMLYLLD